MDDDKSLLLALPDPCLLAVLQCCAADDQRSLFSAARAHSRLQQAAMVALHTISITIQDQQHASEVMMFLSKHGRHVRNISLRGRYETTVIQLQLPSNLQLISLQIDNACVQLYPTGMPGIAGFTDLKKLRLQECNLLGDPFSLNGILATAMWQLPAELEHLSLDCCSPPYARDHLEFPAHALRRLQQVTYLKFGYVIVVEASPALQSLEVLTKLVDLRLEFIHGPGPSGESSTCYPETVTASMMSGMCHLTHLELCQDIELEPRVLAGKSKLKHLSLYACDRYRGSAAGEAELLSQLQHLQQLTHLDVGYGLCGCEPGGPPAIAYAALTASSHLRYLNISGNELPVGVWQHLFQVGKQLPDLQEFKASDDRQALGHMAIASACSRLVSCCPGLQYMDVLSLPCRAELLEPLQGLSLLKTLHVGTDSGMRDANISGSETSAGLQALCQLTSLKELHVYCPAIIHEGLWLQLSQLQQLTALRYGVARYPSRCLTCEAPGDEPVWRQLLRLHLDQNDPAVAEGAALAQ